MPHQEAAHRRFRQRIERRRGRARDFGIGIVREQHQQRHLFLRPRRERTLRGEQAHVVRDFAALEKVDEWRAKPGVHQCRLPVVDGYRMYWDAVAGVIRSVLICPLSPRDLAFAAVDPERESAGIADFHDGLARHRVRFALARLHDAGEQLPAVHGERDPASEIGRPRGSGLPP